MSRTVGVYRFIVLILFVSTGIIYLVTAHRAILAEKARILLSSIHNTKPQTIFPAHIQTLRLCPGISTSTEFAFVALLSRDFYLYGLGAAKLGHTLRRHSNLDLIILELHTNPIPRDMRMLLRKSGWIMCKVPSIDGPTNIAADTSRHLKASVYSKFHAWQLVEYKAVVLIDNDTLVLKDPSNIFTTQLALMIHANKTVGAVRDQPLGDCYGITAWNTFNSGVLLIRPSIDEFTRLVDSINKLPHNSALSADQALINTLLKDNIFELPVVYNVLTITRVCEPAMWLEHEHDFQIIHYTATKPWTYSMQWTTSDDLAGFACWFWRVEEYCLLWDMIDVVSSAQLPAAFS
jgi:hypothetical protein